MFGQIRVFILFWESSENQIGRPKKGRQSFKKSFENPPPPPRENPRSAPGRDKNKTKKLKIN